MSGKNRGHGCVFATLGKLSRHMSSKKGLSTLLGHLGDKFWVLEVYMRQIRRWNESIGFTDFAVLSSVVPHAGVTNTITLKKCWYVSVLI